jgi:hypothetical protein
MGAEGRAHGTFLGRASGIILYPMSLPGLHGIGALDPANGLVLSSTQEGNHPVFRRLLLRG